MWAVLPIYQRVPPVTERPKIERTLPTSWLQPRGRGSHRRDVRKAMHFGVAPDAPADFPQSAALHSEKS